jgi:hypothetical protein
MTPDLFEEIVGYRCWDVTPAGLLCSQAVNEPWPPYTVFTAWCREYPDPHRDPGVDRDGHLSSEGIWTVPPVPNCMCGIYAYKDNQAAVNRTRQEPTSRAFKPRRAVAWGAVSLWGTVIEHRGGYRAQYAYPRSLYCFNGAHARRIEKLYGVPCVAVAAPVPTEEENEYWGSAYSLQRMLRQSTYFQGRQWLAYVSPPPLVLPSPPPAAIGDLAGNRMIVSPSVETVKLLGGDRYQQRQAARAIPPSTDWRDTMKRAFRVPKKDPTP